MCPRVELSGAIRPALSGVSIQARYPPPGQFDGAVRAAPVRCSAAVLTVGVLPFVNVSEVPAIDTRSEEVTSRVVSALATVPGLKATVSSSARWAPATDIHVRDLGRLLNADAVLLGNVRFADQGTEVTAQLLDAANGCYRWCDRFVRDGRGEFDRCDDVAKAIADALRVIL